METASAKPNAAFSLCDEAMFAPDAIVSEFNFGYRKEQEMSKINGDKARFHRARKKRIAKRIRYRDLLQDSAAKPAAKAKPKPAPAA